MNYRVYWDGALSDISPTDEEVDDYEVFATFAEAKRELLTYLRRQRDDFAFACRQVRKLKQPSPNAAVPPAAR